MSLSALFLVLVSSAVADADDAALIAELRAESNAAIARHDAAGIVSQFTEEYQITTGGGALYQDGPEEERQLWQAIFDRYDDVVYRRTPESIEVSTHVPRAFERGRWVGTWTSEDGPVEYDGRYAASWSRVKGEWKLRSELFVTLGCQGEGCAD